MLITFSSYGLETFIINEERNRGTIRSDFKSFPFLRCKSLMTVFKFVPPQPFGVKLLKFFTKGPLSMDEKLQLLQNQLQQFKASLSGLERVTLFAHVNKNDQSLFRDHSQLLDHIREQLLPICDSSPVYSFKIDFQSDKDAAGNVIGQILQLPQINSCHCQKVYFRCTNETFIQLPVEVIANWLNRNSDNEIGCTRIGQSKKERLLSTSRRVRIQNAVEICDQLKMVTFYLNFDI